MCRLNEQRNMQCVLICTFQHFVSCLFKLTVQHNFLKICGGAVLDLLILQVFLLVGKHAVWDSCGLKLSLMRKLREQTDRSV